MFEREDFRSLLCLFELVDQDETQCRYKVSEQVNPGVTRIKELVHDKDADKAYCSCKGFEFWGILCWHILAFLRMKQVEHLPDKYILKRWLQSAKSDLDLSYGLPPGLAWPYQENPLIAQIAGQRGGALPIQEQEGPVWLEDPAPVQRQKRQGGVNPFANNDRNRLGANWRNHPNFQEEEEHREEALPSPYRMDQMQPEQGRNLHPVNALNDMGALQRMIREMMEPEPRRGERPTYRKPYPSYIDQIPLSPGFKVPNFTLFNREDPHASSVEHIGRIQPKVTISDLAALKQSEDEPAQDFITRFRKLKMAKAALKISLRKRYDGMLFGDLAELADKDLREEQ
ncbi:unnamed protein product [Prunus armeniaca]